MANWRFDRRGVALKWRGIYERCMKIQNYDSDEGELHSADGTVDDLVKLVHAFTF